MPTIIPACQSNDFPCVLRDTTIFDRLSPLLTSGMLVSSNQTDRLHRCYVRIWGNRCRWDKTVAVDTDLVGVFIANAIIPITTNPLDSQGWIGTRSTLSNVTVWHFNRQVCQSMRGLSALAAWWRSRPPGDWPFPTGIQVSRRGAVVFLVLTPRFVENQGARRRRWI
ncbi:hypothetical protein TWF569_011560 [Orbilia oligospora]|uniref:Uncharacterized protein n=1 Tax=Orbilia oligospora TaxID=2813651 RepID=A0A7C8J7M8_ORBOL|nr:hypothetical protein TWF103_002515 [Orbilia oligospora]KAF3094697.1 hypothetical protein TWF102_007489 [Orbilia oligospora]KAF3113016.1 hypothetical protein TWF706_010025 [Orbilia oligospora]KAF3130668.1 hypothetical protein TWF569_011560 [Orbilia oligospora]KAF3133118.1 hypothetical protein TWF594_009332 [Orbilia oligospora]